MVMANSARSRSLSARISAVVSGIDRLSSSVARRAARRRYMGASKKHSRAAAKNPSRTSIADWMVINGASPNAASLAGSVPGLDGRTTVLRRRRPEGTPPVTPEEPSNVRADSKSECGYTSSSRRLHLAAGQRPSG